MLLKFYAREDLLVNDPAAPVRDSQPIQRVGRTFVYSKRNDRGEVVEPAHYTANSDPYVVDSNSPNGQRLAKRCRRRELWAADEATAKACGVDFVQLEMRDGGWCEKPASVEKPEKKKAS
jgi:hypothetical protein